MKNSANTRRSSHRAVIGTWLGFVTVIMFASMVVGANLSTTVLLVAMGAAPAVVIALLVGGAPAPTVAQILHSVQTKDGRS